MEIVDPPLRFPKPQVADSSPAGHIGLSFMIKAVRNISAFTQKLRFLLWDELGASVGLWGVLVKIAKKPDRHSTQILTIGMLLAQQGR